MYAEETLHHHPAVTLEGEVELSNRHSVPNFSANPTIISKQSGDWFNASTWSDGRIPGVDDVVKIVQGHAVNYKGISNEALAALGVKGTLTFDSTVNSRIKVGTILVYREGKLDVGTQSNPITGNVEIVIANRPLATFEPDPITKSYDPLQFGTGLVAFGEVNIHGRAMTPTWVKLAEEPLAGQNTLTLETTPLGWTVGDKIVLPDTRQTPIIRRYSSQPIVPIELQLEEFTISSISGNTITLSKPLAYDHLGGRDSEGTLIGMPHIGNLTRNIVIRSEDPNGVRGHALFTERAKVDIRYASFIGMGRTTAAPLDNTIAVDGIVTHIGTNQIGRYPIHMHHHMGPENPSNTGYQFALVGNAVDDGAKWGIAIHNSHFGLIDDNVVYNVEGSSIITEEGNERENVFSNNFAVKSGTIIQSIYNPTYGGVTGKNRPLKFGDFGWEGSALWFTGNDNIVTGNVAANAAFAGVMYNARPSGFASNQPLVPNFRGADIDDLTQWTDYNKSWAPEIRLSEDNEVYASGVGIWVGFAGIVGNISNYTLWNIKQWGMYSKRNMSVSYDNITIISNQEVSNQNSITRMNKGIDLNGLTYQSGHVALRNIRVEGFNLGIDLPSFLYGTKPQIGVIPPQVTFVDGAYLRNYVNVREHTPRWAPKYTVIKNAEFVQNDGPKRKYLSLNPSAIVTRFANAFRLSHVAILSRMFVHNYNLIEGNDFEFFFKEQAPHHVMETRAHWKTGNLLPAQNCPTLELTNQQCWENHQVATLDRVASCENETRSEIDGFTCPIQDTEKLEEVLSRVPGLTE